MATGVRRGSKIDRPVLPRRLVEGVQTVTPTRGKDAGADLTDSRLYLYNKSIRDLRTNILTVPEAVRVLARIHGDVSAAVGAMVRLANTRLSFRAYDTRHQIDNQGAALVRSIVARINNPTDYTLGYDDRQALSGVTETLLREIPLSGACAAELVLDEARLPSRILPVPPRSLKFKAGSAKLGKARKVVPVQAASGEDVSLDVATFFYAALDQDPEAVHPHSLLEPAINSSIFHSEVLEDIRRVVRRSGHSRLVVKMLTEKLIAAAPPDVKADPQTLVAWMEQIRTSVKDELEKVDPETALVFFDTLDADYLNSEIGQKADYRPLIETIDGLQATALRTPPSVIGKRMGGSQNVSSTESLLFIKTAAGLQPPVQTVLSRAMTLAARLFGFDGYVMCEFAPIDLRPDIELEAFQIMKQQRVLELLSLGFYTDQEAAEILGTGARAPGAPELSGTRFFRAAENAKAPSPNGDPARRALVPDSPDKGGGESQ